MLKRSKWILGIVLLCGLFMPFGGVKAVGAYIVSSISSSGSETYINSYTAYNDARNAMLNHNSTESNVAVIKQDGVIINAKYAVIKFAYDKNSPWAENGNNEHRLFPSVTSQTKYTTLHAAYGQDAALLDYDDTYKRAKIKVSGYTGWINKGYYSIVPLSQLGNNSWVASRDSSWMTEINGNTIKAASGTPIAIRSGHSTSSSVLGYTAQGTTYNFTEKYNDGTYTWYRIGGYSLKTYYEHYSTGCLIHYFDMVGTQGYTNLGRAPSFLNKGSRYYSFDGNYYYTSLAAMLDDYRNNTSSRAVNSNSPYYPYYMYVSNHSRTKYTANDFNQGIINKGYTSKSQSAMYGEGNSFILSQERYGVNALLTFSAAINESATGTSAIALRKNNLFGHNAYGANPFDKATTYATVADGIMEHARLTGNGYNNPRNSLYYGGHYGNKQSGMNVNYATDPYWGEKAAQYAFITDNNYGLQEWNGNTIGVKQTIDPVNIYKKANTSSGVIYTLKNNYNNINVANMPVTVTDKIYENGQYWYKVYTDTALNDNQDIADINYSFDKSYGYIQEKYLYVSNSQPTIVASDRTVKKGTNLDLMNGVLATDKENGNLTSRVKVSGTVYINVPGEYKITYTVADNQQFNVSKTVTVKVEGNSIPEISASDVSISQYTAFDPRKNISAKDSIDGNITSKIQVVSNPVNTSVVGTYKVKYKVINSTNQGIEKEITVTVIPNEKPVINASNKSIKIGSTFNPLEGVSATDKEDGNITKIEVTENTVNTSKIGSYKVTYKVTDNASQITVKTITVTVAEKVLEQKNGNFYFDSLKVVNGKLRLKGYQTITGIDNNLATNIQYKIIYENIDTNQVTEQIATRITNKNDIPKEVYSPDGKDYTYSWFYADVDLSLLKLGDYKIYIQASTNDYYVKSPVINKTYNTQATSYTQSSSRASLISNSYNSDSTYIELKVREKLLANKNSSYIYNQYGKYTKFEFNGNMLHLAGNVYSYGMNLSTSTQVTRKIIFENKETFETYSKNVGYVASGDYDVALPVEDNLSKTRAWYDTNIDISDMPKGNYVLYLTTTANITDVFEMNERLGRSLDSVRKTINGKTYSFKINQSKGNRIEMSIK